MPLYALAYKVTIEGVQDPAVVKQLKSYSQSIASQSKGATSIKQLKNMVESDHQGMQKLLRYNGFFSAAVHPTIMQENDTLVTFHVDLGHRHILNNVIITWTDKEALFFQATQEERHALHEKAPSVEDIQAFKKGTKMHGEIMQAFEKELLKALAIRGFFHPKILDKKCIVYSDKALVDIAIEIETGPLSTFGPVTISGNDHVSISYILSKLTWNEGDLYDKQKLDEFETALLKTGLFQSVIIDCRNTPDPKGSSIQKPLLIEITVQEGKHRTIGAGINYTTSLGGGASLQLEHRNSFGMGQRMSFRGDVWKKMRNITLTYTRPHLYKPKDSTLFIVEHEYQKYLPYHSSSLKGSILRERNFSIHVDCSWGFRLERLSSTKLTPKREKNNLVKVPFSWRWSSANSLLDPTSGMSLLLKLTPSYQYLGKMFGYCISNITWSGYESLADESITIASRFSFGSILTSKKNSIPMPDRFFGGTENSLRGYKTGSVSPLKKIKKKREPIGGISILTGSFELRKRYPSGFGTVFFYDIGDVFKSAMPSYKIRHIKHACGLGLRYSTPIGPIRLDCAFPIHRRKKIDPALQVYFSIGQSF